MWDLSTVFGDIYIYIYIIYIYSVWAPDGVSCTGIRHLTRHLAYKTTQSDTTKELHGVERLPAHKHRNDPGRDG